MARQQIDLAQLFGSVASTLASNKDDLNQADTYNHVHGDNMVEIFNVISQAMESRKGADPADQLEYASQLLRSRRSGSAKMYSQGLEAASQQFRGQQVTPDNATMLIQSLLGGGQAPAQAPRRQSTDSGDILGSLLGAVSGQSQQQDDGLDLGDLLNAGMAFMQAKQSGSSNLEAAVNALVSSSAMGTSGRHRAQSSSLVASTIMNVIGSMAGK